MERIFYNKKAAIAFIAAIVVLVLLLCMLLATLTQMASLNQRVEKLNDLIVAAKNDETKKAELLEYMKTDNYVIEWAKQHGRISKDDISWIEDAQGGK